MDKRYRIYINDVLTANTKSRPRAWEMYKSALTAEEKHCPQRVIILYDVCEDDILASNIAEI